MWFLYALLSSLSWCAVTIFGKLASQRVDPNLLTTLRAIIMSVMLVAAAIFSRRISVDMCCCIQPRDWGYILLAALFSATAWLFYFTAFKYGLVSKVVSIDRLNFVFIIFVSAYLFGEELTWSVITGTILMVAGVVLIAIA
jgi:transporter family protein